MFIHPLDKYLLSTQVLKAEGSILNLKRQLLLNFFLKNYVFVFIYLAEPGLSCSMRDLELRYGNS